MNLRDKLSFNAKQEDLEVLLAEPFEIDLEDIPIIYVIGWNYNQGKLDLAKDWLKKTEFSQRKKDAIIGDINRDYSSEKRIVLAYLYSHLKEAEISDDVLRDIRTIYDGIMFDHGQLDWNTSSLTFSGPEFVPQVYPEYVEKIKQFKKLYQPALERIKQSHEHDNLIKILNKYIGYDRELGLGKMWLVLNRFDYRTKKERNRYRMQIAKGLSVNDKDMITSIELRGIHNTGDALEQVSRLISEKN
ncbi:MAG: hypothetical protein Q7S27_03525 [Nanoarchaeota archaeon]|nr:hypothetical protein [Nanoarchaeota archaeon]